MTVHVHDLAGCTPTPLGFYLKALGVLRLVAEQADPAARGWWRDERFWLATKLDRDTLERFFVERYEPTPILAPWNGGSGFYRTWDDDRGVFRSSVACDAVAALRDADASRFTAVRECIRSCEAVIARVSQSIHIERVPKAERKNLLILNSPGGPRAIHKEEGKDRLIAELAKAGPRRLARFLDAAVVVLANDRDWAPLWGRGGTDGKMDFPNVYLRRLLELFEPRDGSPRAGTRALLASAVFGHQVPLRGSLSESPIDEKERAVGLFLPYSAGGANMGAGFAGGIDHDPWDFVLMMEGAVAFRAAAVRRLTIEASARSALGAPFATWMSGVGHSSADSSDEVGSKYRKYEQWLPLWSAPSTFTEIDAILAEGRAAVGRRSAGGATDFARAVARLGVARGIEAFERYGYIERNGQANLAVPLGRWRVAPQPHQRLLDEIDRWIDDLRRAARVDKPKAPGAWRSAARLCDEAVLAVCRNGRDASRWQRLLLALAVAEQALVSSPKRAVDQGLRPIPPLSPEWVHAADDGGAEVRLAVALASQHAGWPPTSHPVREHWTPIDGSGLRFASDTKSIAVGPDVVCTGVELERDCVALVRRRVVRARSAWKAEEGKPLPIAEALPLVAPWACSARLGDIDAFLSRATDDARVLVLARAFMAVRWLEWGAEPLERRGDPALPNALYAIFRLVHLPHGLRRGDEQVPIAVDPEVGARLAAGNLAAAASAALRRLRASGLRPVVRAIAGDGALARRIAASLAFALHPTDVARAADAVTKPYEVEAS